MTFKKRISLMSLFLIIIFGGVFGFDAMRAHFMGQYFAHFSPPPQTISSAKAERTKIQPTLSAIGTIAAVNGVNVSSQVPGIVTQIAFQSGDKVKAGQLLIQLDDSTDQQDLKSFQAQAELAKLNYDRTIQLFKTHVDAQSDLDTASANYEQALASVNKTLAVIAQKHITAPFDGVLGIRQVNLGDYVSPGQLLVTLQNRSQLYVNFSLPENDLDDLKVGQTVIINSDSAPAQNFTGKINAINSTIDPDTRNIQVQAIFSNPNEILYPGAYANVTVNISSPQDAILVPETAVSYTLYGDTVYTLTPKEKDPKSGQMLYTVKQNFVTTGKQEGNKVIIVKGIQAGDWVVTSGQLKLTDGATVFVNNSVTLPPLSASANYT